MLLVQFLNLSMSVDFVSFIFTQSATIFLIIPIDFIILF